MTASAFPAPASPGSRLRLTVRPDMLGLILVPLLAAVGVAAAAVPWLRAFNVGGAPVVLALAAVLPVALATVAARVTRQPPPVSYGASMIALIVFMLVAIGPHPHTILAAIGHDPTRLLTETLPLSGGRGLLSVPILIVWLTGAVTGELLARSTRGVAAPAVPVASYLAAFAATAGAPTRDGWTGPVVLASVVALTLARRAVSTWPATGGGGPVSDNGAVSPAGGAGGPHRQGRGSGPSGGGPLRRLIVGAVLAAIVVAALAYGVPRLSMIGSHPASLARQPQVTSSPVEDPVDAIGALRDTNPRLPARALLSVTMSAPSPGYLGVATLDDYNGDIWSFDTTFHPTGGRIPAPLTGAPGAGIVSAATLRQTYELLHPYGLPLVPSVDRPLMVSGLTVNTDTATGMIVPARAPSFPSSYTVVSTAPDVTLGQLPKADAIDSGQSALAAAPDLGLPDGTSSDIGTALQFLSNLTHQHPTATIGFLQAALTALHHDERRVDPAINPSSKQTSVTRGGTSLAEVINAITISRRATPEQFATMFVLVARQLGIPARIVTGFRDVPAGQSQLATGTTTVTNRQAWTWAEIPVTGVGWVIADPTPSATASSVGTPRTKAKTTPTTLPSRQANVVPPSGPSGRGLEKPVHHHPPHQAGSSPWVLRGEVVGGILVLLLLLGPGLASARRAQRRQRRRGGPPASSAAGAWLELLDELDLAGLPTAAAATTADVARAVGARFGEELVAPVTQVAGVAERAVCSPSDPPGPDTAAAAWRLERSIARQVRRTVAPSVRARALLQVGHQTGRPTTTLSAEIRRANRRRRRGSGDPTARTRRAPGGKRAAQS